MNRSRQRRAALLAVLLYKQRECAGGHAPKGRADTGYYDARERHREGDEHRLGQQNSHSRLFVGLLGFWVFGLVSFFGFLSNQYGYILLLNL